MEANARNQLAHLRTAVLAAVAKQVMTPEFADLEPSAKGVIATLPTQVRRFISKRKTKLG